MYGEFVDFWTETFEGSSGPQRMRMRTRTTRRGSGFFKTELDKFFLVLLPGHDLQHASNIQRQ